MTCVSSKQLVLPTPAKQDPGNTLKDCKLTESHICYLFQKLQIPQRERSLILHMPDSVSKVSSTSLCIIMPGVPSPTASGGHKAVTRTLNKGKAMKSPIRPVPLLPCQSVHRNFWISAMQGRHHGLFPSVVRPCHDPAETSTTRHSAEQSSAVWTKQAQQPIFQMASGLAGSTARKGLLAE